MASSFTTTPDGLFYEERHTGLLRAFIAAVGVTAIVSSFVFVELMRQTGWPANGAQVGGIAASVIGLVAFWTFGFFCLRMAFHLMRQTVLFDPCGQRVVYGTHALSSGRRQQRFAFNEIASFDIVEHKPEDGTPTFALAMVLRAGTRIEMGAFNGRERAQEQLAALRQLTGCQT